MIDPQSSPAFAVLPQPVVEMAFVTNPGDAPVYVDVTKYLRSGSIHRGRQNDLARYDAGTVTLRLDNRQRHFDPTCVGATNLVANPSFETNTTDYSAVAATILRDAAAAAIGGFGLRVTTTNVGDSGAGYAPTGGNGVPVTAGLSYAFLNCSRLAVAGSKSMKLQIRWLNAAVGLISVSEVNFTLASTVYAFQTLVATAPALAAYARLRILTNGAGGVFDFFTDAWQLAQGTGFAYIDGDQAGDYWDGTPHASISFTNGRYYPYVKPLKKVRISAVWNAVTYRLFTGFVETWPQTWPGNRDGTVEISATDGFKNLGLAKVSGIVVAITDTGDNGSTLIRITAKGHGAKTGDILTIANVGGTTEANGSWTITVIDDDTFDLQGSTFVNDYTSGGVASTYPLQRSDLRLTALLNAAAWPAADRALDVGISLIQPTAYDKTPSLGALQAVEISENGRLFMSGAGLLTFQNRHSPYLSTSAFTFTGAHYQVPTVEYDDSQIWNEVIVTRDASIGSGQDDPKPQTKEDATSQAAYLIRTLEISGMQVDSDNECNDAAQFHLTNKKDPAIRISALQFRGGRLPSTLWPQLLVRELGERVTATVQPPAGGAAISQESFVEGLDIDFAASPTDWNTVMHLSGVGVTYLPYGSGQGFFVLGDATLGKVGSTGTPKGVLAY